MKRSSAWKGLFAVLKRMPKNRQVFHDVEGITVKRRFGDGTAEQLQLHWNDIQVITAYKRDCLTVDLICLSFSSRDQTVEIDEEMDGYASLVQDLPQYLEDASRFEQWFQQVAFPAFETKPTAIFRRK
jgi:hypothetical protein